MESVKTLVRISGIRCDHCGCQEAFREDNERYKKILEMGWGLNPVFAFCTKNGCFCHTGLGEPKKLKLRFLDYGEVPF